MLHPSEYHPSADRFTRMLATKGVRFVPDRERPKLPDYHKVMRDRREEAHKRIGRHYEALPAIRAAFDRAVEEAKERGRLFNYTGIEPPRKPLHAIFAAIKNEVADKHGITVHDLESAIRHQRVCKARFEAMYRCRHETLASLPQIGRAFGNRDHTTVIHGIRRHQARIEAGEV